MSYDLKDYVDVKTRIELALEKYPELSLQFEFKGVLESNPAYIWGIAYAYRTPDDPRPGIGTAAELAEGRTPYTRGSEIMVLETSAWGRALAALGVGLGKSIATAQEVAAAKERADSDPWQEREPVPDTKETKRYTGTMTEKQYGLIKAMFNHSFHDMTEWVNAWKERNGKHPEAKLSTLEASQIIEELKNEGYVAVPKRNVDQEAKGE